MLATGLVLALLIGIFALILNDSKSTLIEQTVAKRWSPEGDYAQNTIFFSPRALVGTDRIRELRYEIMKAYKEKSVVASFEDTEETNANLVDCYCAFQTISLYTENGNGTFDAVSVGGNFFQFHPVHLLSGNYFSDDDLMNDYILLDVETAWKLFGSTDVAGMRVNYFDKELYVAGVYERAQSEIDNLAAGGDNPRVFVSYDVLNEGEAAQQITCYELLSPNPIPNFAYDILHNINIFSQDQVKYIQNSTRFSYTRYFDLLKERKSREMRTDDIILPYWENVARYKEGRMMYVAFWQWVCAAVLFVLVFVNLMVFIAKHKPDKETFTKIGDKIAERRRNRKTKEISFDAGEDMIPEKLYEDEEEFIDLEEELDREEAAKAETAVVAEEVYSEEQAEAPAEMQTEYVESYSEAENAGSEYVQNNEGYVEPQTEYSAGNETAENAEYVQESYDVYSNPANAYGYIDENEVKGEGTDDE